MTTRFLGFRLAGPLASWGDVTVGDVRSSWPAPSASALTGLLAAAMGVRREDEAGQAALSAFRFAVRLDVPGVPLIDFQTVESANTRRRAKPIRTRREEVAVLRRERDLASDKRQHAPKVTQRTYYADQVSTVLAWGGDVEGAAAALARPAFFLCLGRRACPPSRPPGARVVEAETIRAAFEAYDAPWAEQLDDLTPSGAEVFWDARPDGPPSGLDRVQTTERRDLSVSRGADWTFAPRPVASGRWSADAEEGAS